MIKNDETVRSLDHFLITVDDLDLAGDTYRRLGFHVRPKGQHIATGSENCIIHFANSYLELFNATGAIKEIKEEVVDLSLDLASQVLQRNVKDEDNNKFVQSSLKEINTDEEKS